MFLFPGAFTSCAFEYTLIPTLKLLTEIRAKNALPLAGDEAALERRYARFAECMEAHGGDEIILSDVTGIALLNAVFGNSPYLSNCIFKETEFFLTLCRMGAKDARAHLFALLAQELTEVISQEALMRVLRRNKMRCSLLVALADISGLWELEQVTGTLSRFAEASVQATVDFLLRQGIEKGQLTRGSEPEASGLIVLAMGKLGAGTLNYSSDIDLILFFDPEKTPYTGTQTAQLFFNRFAQDLTKILEERTADGYVFRVDLRLRPDPASTPAVVSTPAAERYYETVGQNWERAALIKARAIAGDMAAAERFLEWLSPFIWRKYLDYASIQDIHSIKRQIESKNGVELPESLLGYNVKLGHGGIREVEFFAVTQQLIWGGKQPKLRSINTEDTLRNLTEAGKIKRSACDELIEAYRFYRRVEHRLQMVEDHQTHSLPDTHEAMERFAIFMGFDSALAFEKALTLRLKTVQRHYAGLFRGAPSLASPVEGGSLVFTGTGNDPETVRTLTRMGFENGDTISEIIRGWHHGRRRATRTKRARELITELTPALLTAFARSPYPDQAFARFDEFLSRLPSSIQIFALFYSRLDLLDIIAEIMGGYPYLAEGLSRKPELLDYLLSTDFFLSLPPREILITQLEEEVSHAHSFEDVLDIVRRFTHDRQFRIGIQLIKNRILIAEVARALSDIADAVLTVLQDKILAEFREKHGAFADGHFAVLAFGKLGSRELTFGSDLDLVFVYEADSAAADTADLSINEYYARLARRIITAITAMTGEGRLYEIDTRLRPSGKDGPVASSFTSFCDYYANQTAWTWEVMALTRARVVTGDDVFKTRIRDYIKSTLGRPRDTAKLAADVREMRERMEKEHQRNTPFDIKYVRGGLIDLEFIAQYIQLAHGHAHPKLLKRGVGKVLSAARKAELYDAKMMEECIEACELYQSLQFYMRIIGIRTISHTDLNQNLKATLVAMLSTSHLQLTDFVELEKTLVDMQKRVKDYFYTIIK